jgi:hypothetical protein
MMMMHIQDPIPNVLNLRPDVPAPLAEILERALAKEPQHRYATAADMAVALRAVNGSTAVYSPPAPPPTQKSRTALTPTPLGPSEATTLSAPPPAASEGGRGRPKWAAVGVATAVLLLLLLFGYWLTTRNGQTEEATTLDQMATIEAANANVALTVEAFETRTAVTEQAGQSTPPQPITTEDAPTTAVALNAPPTPTPFPEVVITNIARVSDVYVVQYNTIGFTESAEGMHIHFFFNTTPPREAGRPFNDFFMYAGPSPYAELRLTDKPEGATQICALVANPDHTVQGESGNCFDLPVSPEANVPATPTTGTTSGIGDGTAVMNPTTTTTTPTLAVRIDNIREEAGVYLVEYSTTGYTEQLPGVHVHFFFDTVAPDNAGLPQSGPWYVWGGPRPFDGYRVTDRPADAQQMCALVANADHTIQPNSGNCVYLPGYDPYGG